MARLDLQERPPAGANDFANAIDGEANDVIDCGPGDFDAAGIDFTGTGEDTVAANCEDVYVAFGPFDRESLGFLLNVDSREEAEAAERAGLLEQNPPLP